jgi:hypothetical protein
VLLCVRCACVVQRRCIPRVNKNLYFLCICVSVSGGGSEHNSGQWNFAKIKKGKEDSEAEKEDRKQSISRGIMDGNYKKTRH